MNRLNEDKVDDDDSDEDAEDDAVTVVESDPADQTVGDSIYECLLWRM